MDVSVDGSVALQTTVGGGSGQAAAHLEQGDGDDTVGDDVGAKH